MVSDGAGNPVVLWGKNTNQAYLATWSSNGFNTPLLVNPSSIPVFTASWAGPDIASHGDTIYVVYKHTPEDTNHIYLACSFDGGLTLIPPARVDFIADSISRFPTVSADASGNPHVAFMKFNPGWTNSRYAVTRSSDYGLTFSPDVNASWLAGSEVCECCPASMVENGNTNVILFRNNLNNIRTMWACVSDNNGDAFTRGVETDPTGWVINACPSSGPDGVIIGDTLYTVFMSGAGGITKSYFTTTSLSTLTPGYDRELTPNLGAFSLQNYPRIAADGNALAVVCRQNVSGSPQGIAFFTDDIRTGFPLTFDVLINNDVENGDVMIHNGKVHVVWQDNSTGTLKYMFAQYNSPTAVPPHSVVFTPTVFPQPASDYFTVSFPETFLPKSVTVSLLNGKALIEKNSFTGDKNIRINSSELPDGFYILSVYAYSGEAFHQKLLISRGN